MQSGLAPGTYTFIVKQGGERVYVSSAVVVSASTIITKREKEVLSKLVEGFTISQVGQFLNISHRTAAVHVDNLRKKLKAANIHHLTAIAVKNGLV